MNLYLAIDLCDGLGVGVGNSKWVIVSVRFGVRYRGEVLGLYFVTHL